MSKQTVKSPVDREEAEVRPSAKTGPPERRVKLLLLFLAFVFAGWQVGLLCSELSSENAKKDRASDVRPDELATRPPLVPLEKTDDRPESEKIRFTPNPAFETLIAGEIRSRVLDLQIDSPLPEEIFYPNLGGLVPLSFSGEIRQQAAKTFSTPFRIVIFGNRDVDQELHSFSFRFKTNKDSKNSFDISRKLRIDPGLYYYLIQSEEGEQLLYTGKFTVMKKVQN